MTDVQRTIAYELHQRAGSVKSSAQMQVQAGEIVALLNALWAAERRGDVAEERLRAALVRWSEEHIDHLLAPAACDQRQGDSD